MSAHACNEVQLVELPAVGLFGEMGWQTVSALEETFGLNGTLARETKGAHGRCSLYSDDGVSLNYLKSEAAVTDFSWNDDAKILRIERRGTTSQSRWEPTSFRVELMPEGGSKTVTWSGEPAEVAF